MDLDYGDRSWAKYKGNVVCRVVAALLSSHLPDFKVSEINAYIEGVKTEFDVLILRKDAKSICTVCPDSLISMDSNTFRKDDVLATIEVKKHGVYFKTDKEGLERMRKYFESRKVDSKPFFYITLRESKNLKDRTKKIVGDRGYFLGTSGKKDDRNSGEWERFIEDLRKAFDDRQL